MDADFVFILGGEEKYMIKYGLSPREFSRAQAIFIVYPDLSPNTNIIPFLTITFEFLYF